MDDAIGTITQVLSLMQPYADSRRVNLSRSGTHTEPKSALSSEFAARQLYHANVLSTTDRAKLPDYIEVILHCKEASRPLNSTCVHPAWF